MACRLGLLDRRQLLALGAAGLGIGCRADETSTNEQPPRLRRRPLGRTGLEVSEITFGAHGVDNPHLMRAAAEAGINAFFTSGQYLDGREEESLGGVLRELAGLRERAVVITGNRLDPGLTTGSVTADIDDSLRRLGTGRIDVYYAGDVRAPEELEAEAFFDAVATAQRAGKVGHLGLSGHSGGMQEVLRAALADGRFEVFLIKYDFVSYPDVDDILREAAERGVGTVVFKTDAGNRRREVKGLEKGGVSFREATVKWALTNPGVASVAVTITSFEQIQSLAAAVGARLTPAETAMLRRYADEVRDRYCRFCGRCEASCPAGVAIADVNRAWMYSAYHGRHGSAEHLYASLDPDRSAAPCRACAGPCEAACPFGRAVRAELVEAHRGLGRGVA